MPCVCDLAAAGVEIRAAGTREELNAMRRLRLWTLTRKAPVDFAPSSCSGLPSRPSLDKVSIMQAQACGFVNMTVVLCILARAIDVFCYRGQIIVQCAI